MANFQGRIAKKMKQSNVKWEKRAIPVPEYDWKKGSPKEFHELFVKRRHPVVLRGFMKDENLLKEYGYDKMLKKYGEEDVMLTTREKDGYPGQMKEVENPKVYMHNSEVLFNKYPKIWDELKPQKPEPYMNPMRCGHAQLFVGRKGTGTPFHSANTYNWFYMVDGSKRWVSSFTRTQYPRYPIKNTFFILLVFPRPLRQLSFKPNGAPGSGCLQLFATLPR